MKRILITGKNSYIGKSFEKYISQYNGYETDTIDMLTDEWKKRNFEGFDTVLHIAGIAHIKETKENAELYYKVNRDLAFETAKKARESGVGQFIFLSSMSVYGMITGVITPDTNPAPVTNYGKSKLEAEMLIKSLDCPDFKTAVLRPPMVYGEGAKGNYRLLEKFVRISPVFPDIENKRSMVHIDTLCECIKEIADKNLSGYFFPQESDYICTSKMVLDIAAKNGKNIHLVKWFNPIIRHIHSHVIDKLFKNLIYKDME